MTQMRYARPRLITSEDQRYQAYVQQFMVQRQNQRAIRPPRQRDIFGGQAETTLRNWLASQMTLSDKRILEYEERRGKRASIKYRELDALVLAQRRAWVFEIKASRIANSLRRASTQLQETRAILRLLYPQVAITILLVDTGIPTAEQVMDIMAGPEPPPRPPATLNDILQAVPDIHPISSLSEHHRADEQIGLLRFSVDDIIAMAGAENLALDWESDADIEDFVPPTDSGPVYSTEQTDSDEDDNPLAAALRRAGLEKSDD